MSGRAGMALGLAVVIVLAVPRMALGVAALVDLDPYVGAPGPRVRDVTCYTPLLKSYQFSTTDRSATYRFEGACGVWATQGNVQWHFSPRYDVDAVWNPIVDRSVALEIIRVTGLSRLKEIDLDLPDPAYVTIRLICDADPWLNDLRCRKEALATHERIVALIPKVQDGPFPFTRGGIPVSRRADLKAEYTRINTPRYATLPKFSTGPGIIGTLRGDPRPSPKPTAPYGATYQPGALQSLNRNQTRTVAVQVTNTGSLIWTPTNPNPFRLSYHWFKGTQEVVRDGLRTSLAGPVAFNQSVSLNANLRAPSSPGTYTLKWDMVHEGVTWFRTKGVPTGDQTVVVK